MFVIKNEGKDKLRDFLKTTGKLKDMTSYIPNYSVGEIQPFDFSSATKSSAIHYLLNGIVILLFAFAAFWATSYSSLFWAILVFILIAAVALLFILAGIKIWNCVNKKKKHLKK